MKTRKNYKRYLLLWVLLVNLLPGMKDGQLKWELMTVEAQQYIVEGMVDGQYKCVNTLDENDWFPSSTTSCLYAQVCACIHCGAEWDCDGPCPNPACPSNNESVDDGFGHKNYCQCCQVRKNDEDICINPACQCSPYYNSGTSDPGGGDTGSNSGGNTGGITGSNQGSGSTPEGEDNDPCVDHVQGKSNPLAKMELAPPNNYNPAGATFGPTRTSKNGIKNHDGVDFGGVIGTPVYASHDGTIASAPYVTTQPNKVWNRIKNEYYYPTGYSGDKNGAGNRIYINIGNNTQVAYWHLQAGTPIATNPRTGLHFKGGDQIYMGEVIGYIGVTGNANPNVPHLHYGIRENGGWKNPFDYINTTMDNNFELTTPCD